MISDHNVLYRLVCWVDKRAYPMHKLINGKVMGRDVKSNIAKIRIDYTDYRLLKCVHKTP